MPRPIVPSRTYDTGDPLGHAPARWVKPGEAPTADAVRAYLLERSITPDELPALIGAISETGWLWRVHGGRDQRCTAKIIVPWCDLWCWSWHQGANPAEALAGALALALASLPPPEPEWSAWPTDPEWAKIA